MSSTATKIISQELAETDTMLFSQTPGYRPVRLLYGGETANKRRRDHKRNNCVPLSETEHPPQNRANQEELDNHPNCGKDEPAFLR